MKNLIEFTLFSSILKKSQQASRHHECKLYTGIARYTWMETVGHRTELPSSSLNHYVFHKHSLVHCRMKYNPEEADILSQLWL